MNILIITPHLSTGGLPQFVLEKTKILLEAKHSIFLVEYNNFSNDYIIQKEELKKIVTGFLTFDSIEDHYKVDVLLDYIKENKIDIVWFEEIPETFIGVRLEEIYNNREYYIIESTHGKPFQDKYFKPDLFIVPSSYSIPYYSQFAPTQTWFYSLNAKPKEYQTSKYAKYYKDSTIHILNIGLLCDNKNQSEFLKYVEAFSNKDIMFHLVGNTADNFKDYWKPLISKINKLPNVKYWGELDREEIKELYHLSDILLFTSKNEYNPLVIAEAASYGLGILSYNHESCEFFNQISNKDFLTKDFNKNRILLNQAIDSAINVGETPINIKCRNNINEILSKLVSQTIDIDYKLEIKTECRLTFNDGVRFDIDKGWGIYNLEFINLDTNEVISVDKAEVHHWYKPDLHKTLANWQVKIYQNNKLINIYSLNFKNTKVYICIASDALGDTIASIPSIVRFKEKYNIDLVLETKYNNLFREVYKDIKFVDRGEFTLNNTFNHNFYIFWNLEQNKIHKNDIRVIPMIQATSDLLGLEYVEERPLIDYKIKNDLNSEIIKPYVCISTQSTADAKEWQNKEGWQEVIDYLVGIGYNVIDLRQKKEDSPYKNISHTVCECSLNYVAKVIKEAEFFIGLGSGLSWLAWALKKKVIMISGFSKPFFEFQEDNYRIINQNVCNGCFNDISIKFDRSRNWCPRKKDFECTKSIISKSVIEKIDLIINEKKI